MTGGAFLVERAAPGAILMPEDLGEEARAIGRTVDEFWAREVQPALPAFLRREPGVARALLRASAALGLTAMQIPEAYGGLDLDLASVMVAVEHLAADASFLVFQQGHSGIGTLPLVYFGTEAQKQHYLPRLASAEFVGAYALTEPHAGSDALASTTRADLSADGRHYVFNGQKAWITNGGDADLFTVFAKVGGERFTAFLVERAFGVRSGAEEHKTGLDGTSTTSLFFDHVPVPIENVLGEIGRGHRVAFTVLNAGRLKMGPHAVGAARRVLAASLAYARERRAFGHAIVDFGAVREKLAGMAVDLYAAESAYWRAVGLIEAHAAASGLPRTAAEAAALHEFAVECAIVKVHASEMLDRVADEGVQIHGGYGYHRDYFVERARRDSRVNRIFEGTNEINRVLIPTQLLKRAMRGDLPLLAAADSAAGRVADGDMPKEDDAIARARLLTLAAIGLAHRAHGDALAGEQELLVRLGDAVIETFTLEATALRARKTGGRTGRLDGLLAALYADDAIERIERAVTDVIVATSDPSRRDRTVENVRRLAAPRPIDVIDGHRRIAAALIEGTDGVISPRGSVPPR